MKIRGQLLTTSLLLVVLPALAVGIISWFSFQIFVGTTLEETGTTLRNRLAQELTFNARRERENFDAMLGGVGADVVRLAGSVSVATLLSAASGTDTEIKDRLLAVVEAGVQGMVKEWDSQSALLQQVLTRNVNVLEYVLKQHGDPALGASQSWKAVNQVSKVAQEVTLPGVELGGKPLRRSDSFEERVPVVDEVSDLVGGWTTLFQGMSQPSGMLRIATSVRAASGKRAVGTFIPTQMPDGSENPVLAQITKGADFVGLAKVVDSWCLTSYRPWRGRDGKAIGMVLRIARNCFSPPGTISSAWTRER
jgi:hypothetical protein